MTGSMGKSMGGKPPVRRLWLLGTTALIAMSGVDPALAQSSFEDTGFSITLGDEVIAGAPPPRSTNAQRVDRQLQRADVVVQFEGLTQTRRLNVATDDLRTVYPAGAPVMFRTSSNYPQFTARSEIRIVDRSRPGGALVAVVPTTPNGTAGWEMPADGPSELAYTVRVYDARGRYDETAPLPLNRSDRDRGPEALSGSVIAAGEAESRIARRGIPIRGGSVIVSGSDAPPRGTVTVMGDPVPVDAGGRFVVSRILPPGDQIVTVNVGGRSLRRDVSIPESDWFYVGLIDITAGITRGGIDNEEDAYVNGRLAYYVSGQTASGWHITSSADTQDGPLRDAFSRLNDKDPRRVLDRLRADGDDLYPTYGDDSTAFDDTPTSGNVYVRVENDTTRLLWGDFDAGIAGPGLLNSTRDLYGLQIGYRSPGVTAEGEPRIAATAYAAQPETRPQRDILRGTGGSVYFLSRQDITGGSTSVTVQAIDADTGVVVDTRVLVEGTDYTVDHLQGVLTLASPLASGGSDGGLIGTGGSDLEYNLVAQYEFTPTDSSLDDNAFGGRVEAWVTEDLRLGLTAMREETGAGTQDMLGADMRYTFGSQSFAQIEVARTDGPGFSRALSTDGGLTITSTGGVVADEALAVRANILLDFGDLGLGRDGSLALVYDRKDAGFSTLTEDITEDQELIGLAAEVALTDRADVGLSAERFTRAGGETRTESEITLAYDLTGSLTLTGGLAFIDKTTPGDPDETGKRLDAALKLSYDLGNDAAIWGFVQGTINNDGGLSDNNRVGIGAAGQLTDRLTATGEVSDGDDGLAAEARLTYRPSANNEVYLGYSLDPSRSGPEVSGDDRGRLVFGGTYRHNELFSTFTETVFDQPGNQQSLTQAYGVAYTPDPAWVLSGSIERGTVRDSADGDFDRLAVSIGAVHAPNEDRNMRVRLEYRSEDGDGTDRDRETWGLSAAYTTQTAEDWRLIADVEALYSDSAEGDFRDGEYVRASLGYAYRPVDNERFNMLLRYTHLRDLPGEDQVDANGDDEGPFQRSNVLSVAMNYDLTQEITLGGKLGHRMSEVAERGTNDFVSNSATLLALRMDVHMVEAWDILAEGRVLWTEETGTRETGALMGVYRHIGPNTKVGIGYEWGDVSDDETDIDYDSQGLFLNIVGKF